MANRGRPRKDGTDAAAHDMHDDSADHARQMRTAESREAQERPMQWKPPTLLPTPEPRDGYEFRWVRSAMLGQGDTTNVSAKFREGWVPVKADDFPELHIIPDHDSRFPDNIEVGGLILCMAPTELMQQRREYQAHKARSQMDAVDRNFMRNSDPRMPVLPPERRSRVSNFGND